MSEHAAKARMPSAAALYFGEVMHARLKPIGHRFSYRVMSLLIDLDRLEVADRQSRLFGVNRAALYSFNEQDHGERDGSSLRIYARQCAARYDIDLTGGRVLLLCYPRLLGFTFNPLSIYFCYRADGELALMIYEVRNTFGDIHAYVLPVKPGELSDAGLRQQQDKLFYVSPFIDLPMRYHFRVSPPGAELKLRILETDRAGPLLAATFHGRRRELTTAQLLRSFLGLPLVTLKIVAAIHWEALRLWVKGARLVPRPTSATGQPAFDAGSNTGANTVLASGKSTAYTAPESHAEEERSGPVTVDVSYRSFTRRAGHRATSSDESADAGRDLRDPRQCRGDAAGPAAPGQVGARLRLQAAARHP